MIKLEENKIYLINYIDNIKKIFIPSYEFHSIDNKILYFTGDIDIWKSALNYNGIEKISLLSSLKCKLTKL